MDPDHRLLLRNTKPLLQSRNTAVSLSRTATSLVPYGRVNTLYTRTHTHTPAVRHPGNKPIECRCPSPGSLKVSVAVRQREEKCSRMKALIKM